MNDSPAAAKVWAYLEHLGCERVVSTRRTVNGADMHRVEIRHQGAVVAIEEHASQGVASSRAILDAVQLVGPPPRAPQSPRPFASTRYLPTTAHPRPA